MKKVGIVVIVLAVLGGGMYGAYSYMAASQADAWAEATVAALDDIKKNGCENYKALDTAKNETVTLPRVQEDRSLSSLYWHVTRPCRGIGCLTDGAGKSECRYQGGLAFALGEVGWDSAAYIEEEAGSFPPRYSLGDVVAMIDSAKASGNPVVHALLDEGEGNLYELCKWFRLADARRTEYSGYADLVAKCAERSLNTPREAEKYLDELKRSASTNPDPTTRKTIAELERKLATAVREETEYLEEEAAKLPDLQIVGETDGRPTLTIINASYSTLNLQLGHDLRYRVPPAKLPPGEVSNDRFGPCHNKVPTFSEAVPAGVYRARVTVDGSSIRPFSGAWKLVDGNAYALCLYIETRQL